MELFPHWESVNNLNMEYVVYIQSLDGFPWDDWACSAYLGFKSRGSRIVLFEQIEEVPLQRWVILIASVENTRDWLLKMDVVPEKLEALNIPTELWKQRFLRRETIILPLGDLKEQMEKLPGWTVFVKPAKVNKAWTAFLAHSATELGFWLHGRPDEELIFVSSEIFIRSEYRCYIQEGKIIGVKHYLGDPLMFPDAGVITDMVIAYRSCPAAYVIDVGVDVLGRTLLIECNDGWSLGNYGLDPITYVRFLMARWRELMGIGVSREVPRD